jgi:hypothetical protein
MEPQELRVNQSTKDMFDFKAPYSTVTSFPKFRPNHDSLILKENVQGNQSNILSSLCPLKAILDFEEWGSAGEDKSLHPSKKETSDFAGIDAPTSEFDYNSTSSGGSRHYDNRMSSSNGNSRNYSDSRDSISSSVVAKTETDETLSFPSSSGSKAFSSNSNSDEISFTDINSNNNLLQVSEDSNITDLTTASYSFSSGSHNECNIIPGVPQGPAHIWSDSDLRQLDEIMCIAESQCCNVTSSSAMSVDRSADLDINANGHSNRESGCNLIKNEYQLENSFPSVEAYQHPSSISIGDNKSNRILNARSNGGYSSAIISSSSSLSSSSSSLSSSSSSLSSSSLSYIPSTSSGVVDNKAIIGSGHKYTAFISPATTSIPAVSTFIPKSQYPAIKVETISDEEMALLDELERQASSSSSQSQSMSQGRGVIQGDLETISEEDMAAAWDHLEQEAILRSQFARE